MNTVRHIRTVFLTLMLLVGATAVASATDLVEADIIIEPCTNGTVVFKSVDKTTRTVTITVTPASGYSVNRNDIVVRKLVDPGKAQAPRRTPAIAESLTVTGSRMAKAETDYTFIVPADYAGARVTVTFLPLTSATATITPNILTYTGEAQPLVTQGAVLGCSYSGTTLALDTPLNGYFTLSAGVYKPCSADGLADGTTTYYKPDVTYSLTGGDDYTSAIPTATNAGDYTVYYKVAPDATHAEGSGSVAVTINKAVLTEVQLVQSAKDFTGSELTFEVSSVKAGTLTVPPAGYIVSGHQQTSAGNYTLTVTGTGNYTGTAKTNYVITAAGTIVIDGSTTKSDVTNLAGTYILATDVNASVFDNLSSGTFTGTLDGNFHTIRGISSKALFDAINGGTVKNVILEDATVSSGNGDGDAGAICNVATGAARIYNCGIISTTTNRNSQGKITGFSGSSVSGTRYVGGLVGLLDGTARVINCFSYANITGGSEKGGIVGYNNYASKTGDIKTMVMNCMFYGNIATGGDEISPIYGGLEISNEVDYQLNNYNYFLYEAPFSKNNSTTNVIITKYNRALAAEERYLNRFEFYRNLVNSTRELAAWYATGSTANAHSKMAKWVLDKSIAPYPILKPQGYYPSVVNYDPEYTYNAEGERINRTTITERAHGKYLGKTLSVTITQGSGYPAGATIVTGSLSLPRIDKDTLNFNFNYDKVQLPYYNDVGTKNYTGNKVVTGWKITNITAVADDPYTSSHYTGDNYDSPYYNFADRKSSNKDLYSVSGRVFSQGAYFDVPDGVIGITIEPYWGNAAYLSDARYDCYYKKNDGDGYKRYDVKDVTDFGTRYSNGNNYSINEDSQPVYTSISNALKRLDDLGVRTASTTVYDNAVVLVGNYHRRGSLENDGNSFTVMSADLNFDNEPDYSLIIHSGKQEKISPIRFDFINVPNAAMAHKITSTTYMGILGNLKFKGWCETTNTTIIHFSQFEYDSEFKSLNEPLILLGGIVDMFTSTNGSAAATHTKYIHVGSNVYFKVFNIGCHMDKTYATPHRPISVTGGDFDKFYLSGYLKPEANAYTTEDGGQNAECYICGGRFGEVAGAGYVKINGNVTWQIYDADIQRFFGGGINENKPVGGNISTSIRDSYVKLFCGGPKFGNMAASKTVTTTATGCTFDTYFGAGYGGTAITRENVYNHYSTLNYEWNGTTEDEAITPQFSTVPGGAHHRGKYSAGKGISVSYEYQNFEGSSINTVAYLFVNYASLSLAETNDVTSTLTGCTINRNFYGGGSLGKVTGDATSTLTNCIVHGSAYGAGYSASVPTASVFPAEGFKNPIPKYNETTGVFEPGGGYPDAVEYTWSNDEGSNSNTLVDDGDKHWIHVDRASIDLSALGTVDGTATLNIDGNTIVEGKVFNADGTVKEQTGGVFGGGDASAALGNTVVNITATGTKVAEGYPDYNALNVFGGGNEADVKGNTTVNMTGGVVYNRMFGGGKLGSVGTFTTTNAVTTKISGANFNHASHVGCIEKPNGLATANTGKCTVNVSGGRVGPFGMRMPDDFGYVFGAGMGILKDPAIDNDIEFRTYVYETDVTISGSAFIIGGVYGGSENGRVLTDTHVEIAGGQIGCGEGMTEPYQEADFINPLKTKVTSDNALAECAHWSYGNPWLPYDIHANASSYDASTYGAASTTGSDGHTFYGNVFGGGSGYFTYEIGGDGATNGYEWLPSAGLVEGDTYLTISGGHILTNAYGGNEMTDVTDTCNITMTGGTLGVPRTLSQIAAHPVTCYLFGASKGDQRVHFNKSSNVGHVNVTLSGGIIYGSVFGGGEDGHVNGNVTMNISETDATNHPMVIGTHGTSYVDGNVFGGGRGFGGDAYTSGNIAGCVTMNITGGRMLGSIYGGGRLGSVGYGLFMPGDNHGVGGITRYGRLRPDYKDDDDLNSSKADFPRGYVTINISGGTIGNDTEYTWNPSAAFKTANMPYTLFEDDTNRLLHTKGGNVFAGGMGRREMLDGVTPIPYDASDPASIDWHKLGNVKGTKVTISGDAWIKSNVYGGGELGAVRSYYEGTLSEATNIQGGNTEVIVNGGTIGTMIGEGISGGTRDTESTRGTGNNRYCFGSVFGGGYGTEKDIFDDPETPAVGDAIPYNKNMEHFGALVVGDSKVTMNNGRVLGSVYGGGELACIGGSSVVEIKGGEIGVNEVRTTDFNNTGKGYVLFGSWRMGNVYGGGRGSVNAVNAGLVRVNATVNISGSPGIYHNVYGGGALGSVGWFTFTDGIPTSCSSGTGTATITITGTPTIGISGRDNGMVNGSSRGDISKPVGEPAMDAYDKIGWVNNSVVTVGKDDDESAGPHIKGSLYGGGENGHNFSDATVTLKSGTIGIVDPADPWYYITKDGATDAENAALTRRANKARGNVYGSGCGTDTYTGDDGKQHNNPKGGIVIGNTKLNINGGTVRHDIFGGGSMGAVGGTVEVNMNGGLVIDNIYGGCAKANSNINNCSDYMDLEGSLGSTATNTTTVNLHGGVINGDVFGGGLGQLELRNALDEVTQEAVEAIVFGDVTVKLNENNGEPDENDPAVTKSDADNCVVKGTIFGCNNFNGTPKGSVTVHIYKTVDHTGHAKTPVADLEDSDDSRHSYNLAAVYGGGNLSAYVPVKALGADKEEAFAHVIIDGCGLTSIRQVYGGGNAASTPGTQVDINGTYEIEEVFGGGNGKDDISKDEGLTYLPNPGANVGFYEYSDATYSSYDSRQTTEFIQSFTYGTGKAKMFVHGGRIHHVYGGSNTKGNVREVALTMLEDETGCPFNVNEAYGGGKSAPMDGEAKLEMACIPGLKNAYGGAEAANINNDVVLNITNGHFDRVFGGNNISGTIKGTITVNIEETGCHLLTIGQLFGGGNQASYTAPAGQHGPTLNVRSFSSIGEVYGGGYGSTAWVNGDTYVNINVCDGKTFTKVEGEGLEATTVPDEVKQAEEEGEVATHTGNKTITFVEYERTEDGGFVTDGSGNKVKHDESVNVYLPPFTHGSIGAINNVYGGGYGAEVRGSTYVNIGTKEGENEIFTTPTSVVNAAERTWLVRGAKITGNVFGGGNQATVTGDTHVTIGKQTN